MIFDGLSAPLNIAFFHRNDTKSKFEIDIQKRALNVVKLWQIFVSKQKCILFAVRRMLLLSLLAKSINKN